MNVDLAGYFMVWNKNGYFPRYRHATFEAAQAEAERLAAKQPTDAFYVLHIVTRSSLVPMPIKG